MLQSIKTLHIKNVPIFPIFLKSLICHQIPELNISSVFYISEASSWHFQLPYSTWSKRRVDASNFRILQVGSIRLTLPTYVFYMLEASGWCSKLTYFTCWRHQIDTSNFRILHGQSVGLMLPAYLFYLIFLHVGNIRLMLPTYIFYMLKASSWCFQFLYSIWS